MFSTNVLQIISGVLDMKSDDAGDDFNDFDCSDRKTQNKKHLKLMYVSLVHRSTCSSHVQCNTHIVCMDMYDTRLVQLFYPEGI